MHVIHAWALYRACLSISDMFWLIFCLCKISPSHSPCSSSVYQKLGFWLNNKWHELLKCHAYFQIFCLSIKWFRDLGNQSRSNIEGSALCPKDLYITGRVATLLLPPTYGRMLLPSFSNLGTFFLLFPSSNAFLWSPKSVSGTTDNVERLGLHHSMKRWLPSSYKKGASSGTSRYYVAPLDSVKSWK
jgi:hypothetical protein